MLLNHIRDSLKSPVNLLTADDERGSDWNHSVMRLDSFFVKALRCRAARGTVQFDADPQAFAALLFQSWQLLADRSVRATRGLGLLGWAQQNLANKRLRGLRCQHGHDVRYVFRLQHLRGIFSGMRAQFGVH